MKYGEILSLQSLHQLLTCIQTRTRVLVKGLSNDSGVAYFQILVKHVQYSNIIYRGS